MPCDGARWRSPRRHDGVLAGNRFAPPGHLRAIAKPTELIADFFDVGEIMGGLYGEGIIALQATFPRPWVAQLRDDIELLLAEAQDQAGGVLPRGPQRYYVEVHPQRIRGFTDIATHPWFVAVCRAVLGPDYRIVEAGFDIPFPGAEVQPWHRDFAVPDATMIGRRPNSLAFNLTTVDTVVEMGPLEIAPGTHWDRFEGCPRGMFPPRSLWPRYQSRLVGCLLAAIGRTPNL